LHVVMYPKKYTKLYAEYRCKILGETSTLQCTELLNVVKYSQTQLHTINGFY